MNAIIDNDPAIWLTMPGGLKHRFLKSAIWGYGPVEMPRPAVKCVVRAGTTFEVGETVEELAELLGW